MGKRMKHGDEMKAVVGLSGVAIAGWILSVASFGCGTHYDPPLGETTIGVDAQRDVSSSESSVAFLDPNTGRFVEPTSGQSEVRAGEDAGLGQLRSGIREEPGRTAAGGVRVRLQGTFAPELIAFRDADGTIRIVHAEEPAGIGRELKDEP